MGNGRKESTAPLITAERGEKLQEVLGALRQSGEPARASRASAVKVNLRIIAAANGSIRHTASSENTPPVVKSDSWLFGRGAARLSAMVVAWSLSGVALAEGRTPMQEAVASKLPKFQDGTEVQKPPAAEEVKTRATLFRLPASAMIPPAKVEPPAKSEPAKEAPVLLPQVTVTGKSKPAPEVFSPLPRLNVRPPVKDLPAVPFETPSARQARLVRKHLTAFDRLFLNRFTVPIFGISQAARAERLEREEATALAFNEVAEGIEWVFWTGKTPAEKKQLKEMYYDVLVARPK